VSILVWHGSVLIYILYYLRSGHKLVRCLPLSLPSLWLYRLEALRHRRMLFLLFPLLVVSISVKARMEHVKTSRRDILSVILEHSIVPWRGIERELIMKYHTVLFKPHVNRLLHFIRSKGTVRLKRLHWKTDRLLDSRS